MKENGDVLAIKAHITMKFDRETLWHLGISFENNDKFHDFCLDTLVEKIKEVIGSEEIFSLVKTDVIESKNV